jgi:DNA-binding transcriptional MocR family regulator
VAAGLFAPVSLPGVPPRDIAAAAALGIGEPVAPSELAPGPAAGPAPALLLGFAGYSERAISDAVAALADALGAASPLARMAPSALARIC